MHTVSRFFLAGSVALVACSGGPDDSNADAGTTATDAGTVADAGTTTAPVIEVAGTWADNFGSPAVTITDTAYGTSMITKFDNTKNWFVYLNPANAEYNPSKYGRVHWTEVSSGTWYMCNPIFDKATAQEAESDPAAPDVTALDTNGCGGFSWSKMSKK